MPNGSYTRIRVVVVLAMWILGVSSWASGNDYQIRLTYPDMVGDTYRVSAVAEQISSMNILKAGEIIENVTESFSVKLEADATVLEVSEKRQPTHMSLGILNCIKTEANLHRVLVPAGTTIHVTIRNTDEVFEIDGLPVSEEIREALLLIGLLSTDEVTNDDVFGTTERKQVGDTWNINQVAAAKSLQTEGLRIKTEDVTGTIKLAKIIQVDAKDCLQISGTMFILNAIPAELPELPLGFELDKSSQTARISWLLPVQLEPSVKASSDIEVRMTFVPQRRAESGAPDVCIEVAVKQSVKASYSHTR